MKCESDLTGNCPDIEFSVGVGRDEKQEFRGPVRRNFFEHSWQGLDSHQEEWDFRCSIDEFSNFMVTVRIARI